MSTSPQQPPPGIVVGGYQLLTRLGEGGMGVVHLAQRPDGHRVALKVLRPHIVGDDEARARLAREVGSLSRIRSRWVAEIVDADPWAEIPYVATRYVPGLSLHDLVAEEGPVTGDDLRWFAECLAEGLASVHAVGVLHRDVKPSNVLMEGRTPILIDFGLARVADDPRLTHTGWLLGTPGYLAPEILHGDDATTASDVHSWAATVAYAGTGRPVVFVPSLINPPFILDLAGDRSLLRWLAANGVRPMLVDWGSPSPEERDLDITGHVETLLLPLLRALAEPPVLAGYCLGGTMALAAASALPVAGLALLAAPWHFAGFGAAARAEIATLWAAAEPACRALGLVPMEVLQSGFWRLDPARTIAKYAAFAALDPASSAAANFVALEDWANAGAPLTYAAGAQLFAFFADDAPGRGRWTVAGRTVDPAALACPAVDFVSTSDRIVPARSAARLPDTRTLGAGHVGMIVGSRARPQLWEPLAHWIAGLP